MIRVPIEPESQKTLWENRINTCFLRARSAIRDGDLEELCQSIIAYQSDLNSPDTRRDGLTNAPMVILRNGKYEVFAGERRIKALRLLHGRGQITRFDDEPEPMVTVSIFHGSEIVASTMALVDNLGHVPLDAFEGTYGILNTLTSHMNQRHGATLTLDSTVEYIKALNYQNSKPATTKVSQVYANRTKVPTGFNETL